MKGKVVILNAGKMDYDHNLDFSIIADEVVVHEDSSPQEVISRLEGAVVAVTKEMPVPADMINQFPDSIKLIVEAGTGYNNIDVAAAKQRGITVCNIPAYSSQRVAHTAIMLMLNLASTMQVQIKMLGKGDKSNFTQYLKVPHIELNGKTIGVIGAGNIGKEVIKIAQAMGMKVLATARRPREDADGIHYTTVEDILKNSDVVSLHCPLTPDTKHIINAETLAMMKPTAFLINTSRGALVDEKALIKALQENKIAGAGLDVQEVEPPAVDNPLYDLDNVVMTPHMGWKGMETRQRLVSIIADDVKNFFAGTPINVVN